MKDAGTRAQPRARYVVGALAICAVLLAATAALAGGSTIANRPPAAQTSADAVLARKLDPTLRPLASARSAASVSVLVYTSRGANAPEHLVNPVRIRLGADKTTDLWVGSVSGRALTKLATTPGIRYVADNRATTPPKLPDAVDLDTSQARAAAAKASSRIADATRAGIVKRWAETFDSRGRQVKAVTGVSGSAALGAPSDGNGAAPTGWMDTGATHRSSVAWAEGYTGKGVLVGVADTGVDFAHPDLQGTEATVTSPTSPYTGWPIAYDPYSLQRYASDAQHGTNWVATGQTWFSATTSVVTRSALGTASLDGITYVLPSADKSKSGKYHMGYLNDEQQLGDFLKGFASGKAPVLVTDEHTSGVYDTVRVDLNANEDFTDDKPCTKASPISYLDYWNSQSGTLGSDGSADVSGGMVYWISDGSHQPPGYDLHFDGGTKPAAGNMVCFFGSLDWFQDHGTLCASNIVGQGHINGSSVETEYPTFKGAGAGGMVQGGGKNARLVGIGDVYSSSSCYVMAFDFAAFGLDTIANTGDELQVLSCSFGFSDVDNDEWDYLSRYVTTLNTTVATSTAYVVSSGNGGPGYGTNAAPTPSTGIKVGASTQFGSCGGWDSIVGTDQVTSGDIIGWSNRGPSSMGKTGIDIVADGAYSSGAVPLNNAYFTDHSDGWRAWEVWGGTSRSTPVVAGNLTLVDEAFKARYSRWPTWSEARTLLMSGAKDLAYDSFVQGAGMLDAARSVDLAAGTSGVKTSPSSWPTGAFRGVKRAGFSNIMRAGDSDTTTFTVSNESAAPVNVTVSDVWHRRAWETSFTVTIDPAKESEYDFNRPDYLTNITSLIPAGTDLLVIRTAYPLSEMDPTDSFDAVDSTKNDVRVLAYDWKDANSDGKLWTDGNANQLVNVGEIEPGEYERFTYGYGRATSHEIRVQRPLQRMHSGVFLGFQHRNRATGGGAIHVRVELSAWNRVDWPWLSLSTAALTLPARASTGIGATLTVPVSTPLGDYDGQILVTETTHTTVVPVSVAVAASGASMNFGGAGSLGTLMDTSRMFGYQDWGWRPEAGDWRFFMADVPATPPLRAGARWLVETSWDATPTDIDTLAYGPEARTSSWPSGPTSFFGPYDLGYKGGSANTNIGAGIWRFDTATGKSREWVSAPLVSGLNEIMLHSTLFAGTSVGTTFTGSAGVIGSEPATITIRSRSETGSAPFTFSTSMNLPGMTATVAGLSPITKFSATISDREYWNSTNITVTNAPYIHVSCICDKADLDLYLWRWTGSSWQIVGASESSGGNEDIKLLGAEPGTYAIQVYGYDVPADKTPFTATWDAPQGSSLSVHGIPGGALLAGSSYTMTMGWALPGSPPYPEDNVYHGIVYLGIPEAPQIVAIPVEFVADFVSRTPASLKGVAGYRRATLTWANTASDYRLTRVYRSTTRYATSATDTAGQVKRMDRYGASLTDVLLTSGKRYYYTIFDEDTVGNWSAAAKAIVIPQSYATLSKPSLSPSRPTHGKRFKVSGTISPKHGSKTIVKLYFTHKVGSAYKTYKTVSVTVPAHAGSYTKYVTLTAKGSYHLRAYHADTAHAAKYSSTRSFSMK